MTLKSLFTAAVLLCACAAAHADSFTYNLTFSSTVGGAGGTGTFTIDGTPSAIGVSTFYDGGNPGSSLTSLNISVDGSPFYLWETETAYPYVQFTDGVLSSLRFFAAYQTSTVYQYRSGGLEWALDTSYYFIDAGAISAALAPPVVTPITATPEPASLAFVATGLLGMAGIAKRRLS